MDQLRHKSKKVLKSTLHSLDIAALADAHSTPLLLFDAQKMKTQYQNLQKELPGVQFYFALKAAGHAAAVRVIKDCNGYLDVATPGEVALAQQEHFPAERCMYTHPIKKPSEITAAYKAGLRWFVVENKTELAKFANLPPDIELLVRLSFPNPHAGSDLSYKFGAEEDEAKELVRLAQKQGIHVAGFCLHVGSQTDSAGAYAHALGQTLRIMEELTQELGVQFTLLDIGGGFPVEYRTPVPTLAEVAAQIRPLLAPYAGKLTILAEPGRFVVAPAGTLITSVVGVSERFGKPWYYIDDGLYGAYSIMVYDHMQPHIFALKELTAQPALTASVLAGPTCDSVDIIAEDYPLPKLTVGDLLVSPMMGAYATASATTFNSIPVPKIITINAETI